MKKNYTLLFLTIFSIGFAQIPSGYYDNAVGTGYGLKSQLKTIITNGHIDRLYGSGTGTTNNGLWSGYGTTDRDNGIGYENDNTIVDIYSENPTGVDPYNFNFSTASGSNRGQCGNYTSEGDCYNREHLIPQSYFGSTGIMRNDIQHVYPTDGKVNAIHSDYAFGKVGLVATTTSLNGSKLGNALNSGYSAGFSGIVFEPIDEFKGDVARVYFYFATRYEDQMATFYTSFTTPDCRVMFDGTSNQVFSQTFLNILLTWNSQDPVSTKEVVRNNAAYNHQGNRNPFIDNNSYVTSIWGAAPLFAEDFDYLAQTAVYPNPTNDHRITIESTVEIDDIQLININGQIMMEIKKPVFDSNSFSIDNLNQGFYFLKLSSNNQSVTKKVIVN